MIQEPEEKPREETDAETTTAEETSPETAEAEGKEDEEAVAIPVEVADADEDEDEDDEDTSEPDTPEGRVAELESEVASLKHMLLRARADLENFRKRSEREKQEHVKYANRKVFTDMLDVIDNFERALGAVADPQDNFVIGVKMIQKQLLDVLGNNGVEIINAEGRLFDPYLDEAIAREHTDEYEENAIIEVFQKGFRYHGQLLRPSKVKVAVKPETKDEAPEEEPAGDEE